MPKRRKRDESDSTELNQTPTARCAAFVRVTAAISRPFIEKTSNFATYWSTRAAQSLLCYLNGFESHVPLDCLSRRDHHAGALCHGAGALAGGPEHPCARDRRRGDQRGRLRARLVRRERPRARP